MVPLKMTKHDEKPAALSVSHLSVSYDKNPALWDVSLQVPVGHLVGILGPNGAGKSTFIKTILGLMTPISGKVHFWGEELKSVRQKIAYVPQRESVDWDFPITVLDLVLMGRYGRLSLFQRPRQADILAASRYLDIVGLSAFKKRQISQLSGGEQQRAFLARALVQEADIYIMDEPFVGIDMGTEAVIIGLLKELKSQGKTVFVVHHALGQVETYFDWVILLNIRLIASGLLAHTFTSQNLHQAYGKNFALFDEVLKLSKETPAGLS